MIKTARLLKPEYEGTFFKGHLLGVTCISLFPDNVRCVTGSKDCCLIVWNIDSGAKVHIIKGFRHKHEKNSHFDEILAVSTSDDGIFIASGGKDRLIHIWKAEGYEFVGVLRGHRDSVTGLKFSSNSHTLFSCSLDRTVKIWEVNDMVLLDTLHGHYTGIHDIDSYHNERALTCGFDCSVRLWKTAEESQLVYNGHSLSIDCIRILNADSFITGGEDSNICLWKTGKKKPVGVLQAPHDGCWITAIAVMKKTDVVASGSYNGSINLYEFKDYELKKKSSIQCGGYITALEFTRNGKKLVACVSSDHKMGRWTNTFKHKPGILVVNLDTNLKQ